MANPYLPRLGRILSVRDEVTGLRPIKTVRLELVDGEPFVFRCGQCAMLSVFGKGESMISVSSSPLITEYLQFSVLKTGRVTTAIHDLVPGDVLGIRGPYGNGFPLDDWRGRNLVFVAGGIGLAPVWSVLQTARARQADFGELTLFYGARSSPDLIYRDELEALRSEMAVQLSIDEAEPDWQEFVGFVAQNVADKKPKAEGATAVVCGPPLMIRTVVQVLSGLGFADEQIYTTLENKMKCGIGKCGRCSIGHHLICRDGPVYSWAQLQRLPPEY